MAAPFDESDFVDTEYQAARKTPASPLADTNTAARPPSRQELDSKVQSTQDRLTELRRLQEELEKERTILEEARRRRSEYHNGREEMLQHLTRGIGLLEESEFNARRDAEQMSRTLGDLREHLVKVQTLNDQTWTQENYSVELTRALTTLENARMEWNAAQLKWSILTAAASGPTPKPDAAPGARALAELDFGALCRLGLALNWPIALMALAGLVLLALALFAR